MNNKAIQIKVKERLNKLDSNDYDSIEAWKIVEAFNKAQLEWTRRQLEGINMTRTGVEQTTRRVDDLNILLVAYPLKGTNKQLFYESTDLPDDYMEFSRVDAMASHPACEEPRDMRVDPAEELNVKEYLRDANTCPSFDWAETFCTHFGNKLRIYTNGEFSIHQADLIYYRFPMHMLIADVIDPATGKMAAKDTECEFKDDIVELILDETAAILSGDIESWNQSQRGKQNAEGNN
jgi:hypothetical protein